MKIYKIEFLLMVIFLIICGCSGKTAQILKDDNKVQIRNIAVLPVENKSHNEKTSELFRSRLLEELYFRGYAKLSLDMIDGKLKTLRTGDGSKIASGVTPRILKDLVGADAVMNCTLTQEIKSKIFYAPIKISVSCELHSTETGEIIWKASSESTERSFNFTNKGLEKKSHDYLENVIEEVVDKVIKTLPDGPNLRD